MIFSAKIRDQWPELPALMITAYATPKLAVEAIKAGAMDYLAKPFAPEELFLAVARCAERHRLLRGKCRAARARRRSHSASNKSSAIAQDARVAAVDPDRGRRPMRACWCSAKAARARNWSPARSTP